jgi:hypothetical protein
MSLRPNNPTIRILAPQPRKPHKVLDNRHGTQQRSANTENGVGRQLVARQAIPHAKVQPNGHEDAIDEDERPEVDDGLLALAERVVERRRLAEVGVVVSDLRVWVDGVGIGGYGAAGGGAGDGGGSGAAWLALVVVAGAVDLDAGDLERVGLPGGAVGGRGSLGLGHGDGFWPQRLCGRLLGGHYVVCGSVRAWSGVLWCCGALVERGVV